MDADRLPAENLARRFHETYERLAPQFGYETRKDSAVPWSEVPERNRALMVAVCGEVLDHVERVAAEYLAAHPALHFTDVDSRIRAQHAAESVACAVGEVPYRPIPPGSSPAVRGSCASGPGFGADALGQVRHEFAGSRFAP